MPAAKMIPILDDKGRKYVERFEVADEFVLLLNENYVETKDPDGRTVRVNKKLNRNWPKGKASESSAEKSLKG